MLEGEFGSNLLFGGRGESNEKYATKVAVVATSGSGDQAIVIANYNRENAKGSYTLETADDPALSMKIWEAAAATSAAPSFFKPFVCQTSRRSYLDGALYHNNPVVVAWRESKLLWPDVQSREPDVLLSLGTGKHGQEIEKQLNKIRGQPHDSRNLTPTTASNGKTKRTLHWAGVKGLFGILVRTNLSAKPRRFPLNSPLFRGDGDLISEHSLMKSSRSNVSTISSMPKRSG